jgi:uncharacterized cupin superfamily protein
MADKPVLNIADAPLKEQGHGERFQVNWGRIGPLIGMTGMGCALHVVPPGKRAFPFHSHHVSDEMFFILSGEGEYRFGEQTFAIKAGDVLAAPAGKTAHQIVNTGAQELRYLGFSTIGSVDVLEYPDSKKFAVGAGVNNGDLKTATFMYLGRADAPKDYWDGEPT